MGGVNNSLLMKETNRQELLYLIRERPQSRADLARATGLSRAAVTLIVDGLIKEGLVIEGNAVKSETGRRPTILNVNPEAYIAVGVDISREGCQLTFSDFASNVLYENTVPICDDADTTVKYICDSIQAALHERFFERRLLGVGVCCPGPIDSDAGVILNPPGLEVFNGYNIRSIMESRLSLPVYLEKDTNALAIAEKNKAHLDSDFLFLLTDHGVGCGVIKNGKLFCSKGGMGCEIGHVTLKIDGERCRCGNVGCAELYASIPAMLNKASEIFGKRIDWHTIIELAELSDERATAILNEYAALLSVVCTGAVNLFEPEYIVLGGELKHAAKLIKHKVEERINMSSLSRAAREVKVICSSLGENTRAHAASELVIEKYFGG